MGRTQDAAADFFGPYTEGVLCAVVLRSKTLHECERTPSKADDGPSIFIGDRDLRSLFRKLTAGDQRHAKSASELSRACQWSIDTTSDNGIRGSQPAVSSSGFCRKCVT